MTTSTIKLFFSTSLLLLIVSFKQTNNNLSFSLTPPSNWQGVTNKDLFDNLGKFKTTDQELNKYISDHKGSVLLMSYMKHNPAEHAGLIPAVQVNLRHNDAKSFSQFVSIMTKSAESMKNYLHNFEYIDKPKTITLA